MFEGRFSELLIIFVLALIVLGPEKLPRVVSQVGRWVGRARTMARQFREQLEEEVTLAEERKAQATAQPAAPPQSEPLNTESSPATNPASAMGDSFSHAHPTDANGANPLHPAGAADTPSALPPEVTTASGPRNGSQRADSPKAAAAQPATPAVQADQSVSAHERGT